MLGWRQRIQGKWPVVVVAAAVCLAMLAWRVLFWPGSMTHDGLWVLQGAESGAVTTYHPYLNSLLARVLAVPLGSIGLYATAQAIYCVWVVVWVLDRIYARSRSAWLVFTIGALFLLSAPVGLYLGMFWKDVPFSFAVLFIGYAIYDLRASDTGPRGLQFGALLCLSTVFVVFMRHGHLFNLILVPGLLCIVSRARRAALTSLAAGLVVWLVLVASALTWLRVENDRNHLARVGVLVVMQPFLATLSAPGGYVTDDAAADQDLLQRIFVPGALKLYNPKYGDVALVRPGEELPAGARNLLAKRVARLCLLNLSKCAGDRVQLFFATLLPADRVYGMTFYDLALHEGTCAQIYGMRPDHCEFLERYVSHEKPASLAALSRYMVDRLEQRENWTRRLLIWNNILGLAALLLAFVFWSPRSRIWWAAAFVACQCAIPFAFSTASDFRYYFPLYLWGLVFFPVVIHEALAGMRRSRSANPDATGAIEVS